MATKLNLIIDQGATYTNSSIIAYDTSNTAINLSTYTVASKLRKHYTSTNSVSFTATGNSTGYVSLTLTANVTANIASGRYVYDVELVSNTTTVERIVEGIVTVFPEATK